MTDCDGDIGIDVPDSLGRRLCGAAAAVLMLWAALWMLRFAI